MTIQYHKNVVQKDDNSHSKMDFIQLVKVQV